MSASENDRAAGLLSDNAEVDAIELLKRDHGELADLFQNYESLLDAKAQAGERRALSTQICGMVVVHSMIEEEIFYPAARKAGVHATLLDEAAVEHRAAKDLIFQIGESRPSDREYDARLKVLGEYIAHHVRDEEDGLFAECRNIKLDLRQLAGRLQQRKEQLMRKLKSR